MYGIIQRYRLNSSVLTARLLFDQCPRGGVKMADLICPILYSGVLANNSEVSILEEAECLGGRCAWWDPNYKLCLVEMSALR